MIQGIVNVLKPTGMSSHDIVSQMRRIYQMKKIGHAGTLDPLAAAIRRRIMRNFCWELRPTQRILPDRS